MTADIALAGAGLAIRDAIEVLEKAGFAVAREPEDGEALQCSLLVGEGAGAFNAALRAVTSGRHVLIRAPQSFSPRQLLLLFQSRSKRQAVFLWDEKRQHPAYRLLAGLVRSDSIWRPRYVRRTVSLREGPNSGQARWQALEAIAMVFDLVEEAVVSARALKPPEGSSGLLDCLSLDLQFEDVVASAQISLGEGIARDETILAAAGRKAVIDYLDATVPIRLVSDETESRHGQSARWVSCASPSPFELARLQCLLFLEATRQPFLAQAEAGLWEKVILSWDAIEASLINQGAPMPVQEKTAGPVRLIEGNGNLSGAGNQVPILRLLTS